MFNLDGKGITITDENGRYLKRLSRLTGKSLAACLDEALELSAGRYKLMLDEIDAIIAKYENPVNKITIDQSGITIYKEAPARLPDPAPLPDFDPKAETPEQPKQRKKPGPKPKKKTVGDVAREIEETEREGKMSRDEFVEYFGGK